MLASPSLPASGKTLRRRGKPEDARRADQWQLQLFERFRHTLLLARVEKDRPDSECESLQYTFAESLTASQTVPSSSRSLPMPVLSSDVSK
jgi:hypothetical protein